MKFGVREICDVVFKATTDGQRVGENTYKKYEPVFYIDTAKTSTLEGAATTVYAQGGKGNTRLLAWEGEKTLTFTVEDALLSPLGFSMLTGAGLTKATQAVHTTVTVNTGNASGEITLTSGSLEDGETVNLSTGHVAYGTIVDDAGAVISSLGSGSVTGTSTSGSNTLVFKFGSTNLTGKNVVLDFYVDKAVQNMDIEAGKFAGYYYVEASTLFRDQNSTLDLPAEIIIPKAKIQSNFTFSMASTGDPSTFSFVMDAFPAVTKNSGTKQVLAEIQVVADATI